MQSYMTSETVRRILVRIKRGLKSPKLAIKTILNLVLGTHIEWIDSAKRCELIGIFLQGAFCIYSMHPTKTILEIKQKQ